VTKKDATNAPGNGQGKPAKRSRAKPAIDGTDDYHKKLYVVGDKQTGVLFITIEPLRVAFVPRSEVVRFATDNDVEEADIFRNIAASIKRLIIISKNTGTATALPANVSEAMADAIKAGTTISDAEFCFIANMVNGDWEENRIPFAPLFDVLDYLAGHPDEEEGADTGCTTYQAELVEPIYSAE